MSGVRLLDVDLKNGDWNDMRFKKRLDYTLKIC